jgi:DNA-directed RNA polymerase specialized sigma24 family protein
MSSDGSVTRWLGQLQAGDDAAVEQLWNRYFTRLVGLARQKLRAAPRRAADEEDVALSAFDSFCRQAEAGRFPGLLDRDSLWRLLVVVTARKAFHLIRDETRQKRGGGAAVRTEGDNAGDATPLLEQVLSREPSLELAAEVAEECRRLLDSLDDKELAQIALWRMEGFSVEEIAEKLGYASRSVKRKLQLIRSLWEREVDRE